MLRLTIAQINPTLGDMAGNVALMYEAAREAGSAGSSLVIFPELSLTGYCPGGLLHEPDFQKEIQQRLQELRQLSQEQPQLHWVIGVPVPSVGTVMAHRNALLVIKAGEIICSHHKMLLCANDALDERQLFAPGPDVASVIALERLRIGLLACGDGWTDSLEYAAGNPFRRLATVKPDLVVLINASPSSLGKREARHALFTGVTQRYGFPLVYVNQVGGHGEQVYDGNSFALSGVQGVAAEAAAFQPDLLTFDFDEINQAFKPAGHTKLPKVRSVIPAEFLRLQLTLGLRDSLRHCRSPQVVVGVSGDVNSAVALAIAAEALGPECVTALALPSDSIGIAAPEVVSMCSNLGVRLVTQPVGGLANYHDLLFKQASGITLDAPGSKALTARVRGITLMAYMDSGFLSLAKCSKSDLAIGSYAAHGAETCGLALLGDLYQSEIQQLAKHLNARAQKETIPAVILERQIYGVLRTLPEEYIDADLTADMIDLVLMSLLEGERLLAEEARRVNTQLAGMNETVQGRGLVHVVRRLVLQTKFARSHTPTVIRVRPTGTPSPLPPPIRWQPGTVEEVEPNPRPNRNNAHAPTYAEGEASAHSAAGATVGTSQTSPSGEGGRVE